MTEESQQTGLYELCVECFSQARRMTESSAEVCDPPHLPIWARLFLNCLLRSNPFNIYCEIIYVFKDK